MMESPNFTQVPNKYIDEHMASLSGAAAKIMIAICRKTIGWHKQTDWISFSQLREMTGLSSNASIRKGIAELCEAKLITVVQIPGKTAKYDLNIPTMSENDTATISENDRDYVRKCHSTVSESVNTKERKETIQKKAFAEFVKMTDDEYEKLVANYGASKTAEMITVLDNYKGAKGKKYASDYRAILNWVVEKCAAKKLSLYTPKAPEKAAVEFHQDLGKGLAELKKRIR